MRSRGKYRNILTMVFIAIMLFNYANATMFWHCHRIGSSSVVHSHIYWKTHTTGDSCGGHTQEQLQIIDIICHAVYTADIIPEIHLDRFDVLEYVFQEGTIPEICPVHSDILSLRGPPQLV
jgi:hypothetical protein